MSDIVGFVRKPKIALLDPVDLVAYSRSVRCNSAGYHEDIELQSVLDDKGLEHARAFARTRYHGVMVAVLA